MHETGSTIERVPFPLFTTRRRPGGVPAWGVSAAAPAKAEKQKKTGTRRARNLG
jgi:hypothetical protein